MPQQTAPAEWDSGPPCDIVQNPAQVAAQLPATQEMSSCRIYSTQIAELGFYRENKKLFYDWKQDISPVSNLADVLR